MLSTIYSAGIFGIDGYIVTVECNSQKKPSAFEIVGLPDASIKEAKERVRAAAENGGIKFPSLAHTVNLAPADKRKEGSGFDLAILMGIALTQNSVSLPSFFLPNIFLPIPIENSYT